MALNEDALYVYIMCLYAFNVRNFCPFHYANVFEYMYDK